MSTPPPDWAYRAAEDIVACGTGDDDYAASIIAKHWARESQRVTCVYCSMAYPPGTPESQHDLLSAHIRVCTKHPMREVETKVAAMRRALTTLRTSPSVLPFMSGTPLTSHQICSLIDAALQGEEWVYQPDPEGIDWMRHEGARAKEAETQLAAIRVICEQGENGERPLDTLNRVRRAMGMKGI